MARFFFHFRHNEILEMDTLGIEFPSMEAAYLSSFEAARGIWHDLLCEREDPEPCCFEVHDSDGQLLFELPFAEVIEVCRHHTSRTVKRLCYEVMRNIQSMKSRAEYEQREVTLEIDKARAGLAECAELVGRLSH